MVRMPNRAFVNSYNLIEQSYVGDQTASTVESLLKNTAGFVSQLQQERRKIYILTDITGIGATTSGARVAGVKALRELPYDKAAIFGQDTFMRTLSNFIVRASGQGHKVRVFRTRADAEAWLLG